MKEKLQQALSHASENVEGLSFSELEALSHETFKYADYEKVDVDPCDCDLYYGAVREEYERWRAESLMPQEWPEYEKTNREVAKTAKLGLHWCRCDMNHVGDLGKCSVCGRKSRKIKV